MGHQLGQADALGVIPGTGKVVEQPGLPGVQPGAELLHDPLEPVHFSPAGQKVRIAHKEPLTADGRLKGDPVDIFMQHRHRFHQQKGPANDLVSHNQPPRFHVIL